MSAQLAFADPLPTDPTIVHGQLVIQSAGKSMNIQQASQYGIINWNSFNVGSGHAVHFNNGSGATLNRVTGLDASSINGTLSATGSLYLLNRNGIIIGADGRVLTGGSFVASTLDMTDADFLNGGGFNLFGNSPQGVTNLGKISSTSGDVLLAGYTVSNKGDISAPNGHAGLAAGTRIDVLTDSGWLNGAYAVSLGERGNDVTNEGRIQALVAELRTHNGNIYALAGNNSGLIQATGVRTEDGRVFLTAGGGTVQSSGTITASRGTNGGDITIEAASVENYGGTQDVSGRNGGTLGIKADSIVSDTTMLARGQDGQGGTITMAGTREVLVTSAGIIDASGTQTGGEVALDAGTGSLILSGKVAANGGQGGGQISFWGDRIALLGAAVHADGGILGGNIYAGGGYQGSDIWGRSPLLTVANSQKTYVSDKTVLTADATGSLGKGGNVVVWSDGTTEFAGTIFARGGVGGGNGGLVETSGLGALGVSGTVDASARAPYGTNGRWLLDPKNITIGTLTPSINEFQSIIQGYGAVPSDLTANVRFGTSLDISGNTLVVGSQSGAAFVFEAGHILARLALNSGTLGSNVQIEGDLVATGGIGGVQVFAKGSGWRNGQANLTASLANPGSEAFAQPHIKGSAFFLTTAPDSSVYLAIGDFRYDSPGFSDNGAIWHTRVFANGTTNPLTPFITSSPASSRFLGTQLSVSAGVAYFTDINTTRIVSLNLATGASQQNSDVLNGFGSAGQFVVSGDLLFRLNVNAGTPGGTLLVNRIVNDLPTNTTGGLAITLPNEIITNFSVSGDTLVIGSGSSGQDGSVTVYQDTSGVWSGFGSFTNPTINQVFRQVAPVSSPQGSEARTGLGSSIAIQGDTIAVGMPGLDYSDSRFPRIADRGGVLTLRRSGGAWTADSVTLAPSSVFEATTYGEQLDADGSTLVVADVRFEEQSSTTRDNSGRVYVYQNGSLAASLEGGFFGSGSTPVIGFGDRLAVSGDRIVATSGLIRSFDQALLGRVILFDKALAGGVWRNGTANRVGHYDLFGQIASVALDGSTLAVGTPVPTSGANGEVYVFSNLASGLNNPVTLRNPNRVTNVPDYFGNSLALSGNSLAIGQPPAPNAGNYGSGLSFVSESSVTNNASAYNIYLFENLANNWASATPTRLAGADILNASQDSVGWGYSLALSGDTLVTGYQRDGQIGASRGVYVFERNGTWSASATPVARLVSPTAARNFGYDVDVLGDLVAVSSPTFADGFVYGPVAASTPRSPVFIFQRQGDWRSGSDNHVASFTPAAGATADSNAFGDQIALYANGLVAGSYSNLASSSTRSPVFLFTIPPSISSRSTFSSNPSGTLDISAASITASLSLGTDITLQANNDITINSAINVNNPLGNGGDLSLFAGRNILVNASIFTDNGDLTLVANDSRAIAAQRSAGSSAVVIGRDSLNNSVTLNLGTGNLVINAGDSFENRSGNVTPFIFDGVNPGRYLIYSKTPDHTGALDPTNLLADLATTGRDFIQYNTAFSVSDPAPSSLPAGNGFIYTVQPTVAVNVGNATITYGQTASANLALASVTVGGNTVDAAVFGISSIDLPNLVTFGLAGTVGTSAGGFANAGNYTGGLTAAAKSTVTSGSLFGVGVTTGAAGNLTVNKAVLNVRPDNATKIYGNANPAFSLAFTGFVTGETAAVIDTAPAVTTPAVDRSNVGGYLLTASGGLDNNYTFNFTGTGLLTITARDLQITGLTGVNRAYDATTAAPFSGTATIAPLSGDAVTLGGGLTATASFADKNVGTGKALTFSGYSISGASSGNYNLLLPAGVTATITPRALDIAGLTVADKTYDRTTAASLSGTASISPLAGDAVTLSGVAAAAFADKNAGTNKTVTVSGLSLTGTDAANYTLNTSGFLANIAKLDLSVSGFLATSRVYDATAAVAVTGTGVVNPISGDTVTLAGTASGAFANKNVGTAKTVTVSGLSLAGADAANYNLLQPSGLTADVTPADLAISGVTAVNRVYDATVAATLAGTATVAALAQDSVTVSGTVAASFADKNVGTAKPVTVSGYVLTGDDAANYTVIQPSGLSASITPRPLALSGFTTDNKVYDATVNATGSGTAVFSGILNGDTAVIDDSAFAFAFADKNAATAKSLVISGVTVTGADAANYDATSAFGLAADITPATLTVSGVSARDRVYNATTAVTLVGGSLQGVIGSDTVAFDGSAATGTLADKNIGTAKAVTASGFAATGTDAANYTVVQPAGLTATITAAELNLVSLNADKTYDGTAAATLAHDGLDAVFSGDLVNLDSSAVSASYADKNAGAAKAVTITGLYALTGADAGNYVFNQPLNLTGTIAKRGITVSGLTIADKEYDGTVFGEISGTGTFGGTISGDDLEIDVGVISVTFANKNAGVNKAVTLSGITLAGADADNYSATTPTGLTATITPKAVQVANLATQDKVYDRTATATITGTGALVGALGGDTVVLNETNRSGSFTDKNVGTAKTVTVNGLALTGTDAANYVITKPQFSASITPADVSLTGLVANNRVYDATRNAALTGTGVLQFGALAGVLDAFEDVQLAGTATGTFADKNVGIAKAITVGGLSLSGADAGNYTFHLPTNLAANVTAADLAVTGAQVSDRVYDATTAVTIANTGTVQAIAGDTVTLGGTVTASFANKNVGTAKAVTFSGYQLSGTDAANYNLIIPTGLTANVSRAELALFGIVADDKVYDGTVTASLSGSLQISPLLSDAVTVAGIPSATFANKNAGTAKAVTLAGLSITGADANNYTFVLPSLSADITRRTVTVSDIVAESRVYDGTTAAALTGTPSLANTVLGDDIGFDLTLIAGNFADKNAAVDKRVTLSGDGLTGLEAANYQQSLPFDLLATITPKAIGITGVDAVDRDYDATRNVALTGGDLDGVVTGDTVTLNKTAAAGTIADKNVGLNKPVAVTGYQLAGTDSANYSVAQPVGIDVTIAPKQVDIRGVQIADKLFDGNDKATLSGGTLTGVVTGDAVSLVTGTAAFATTDVGLNKPVTLSGFSLAGTAAANYRLTDNRALTGNILTPLRIITDVIPAEVLRSSADTAIANQRASLAAFNAAKPDTLVFTDYTAAAALIAAGVPFIPPLPAAILEASKNGGPLAAYVRELDFARSSVKQAADSAAAYRTAATGFKELGQQANSIARDLESERGLRSTLVAQVNRAADELAKADANLATIAEARRRIDTLTSQAAEANRLGRGAEAAQYAKLIAEARALVATEPALLAQRNALAANDEKTRSELAASDAKVAELAAEQTRVAEAIDKSQAELSRLEADAKRTREWAANVTTRLETSRAAAETDVRAAAKLAEDALGALKSAPLPDAAPPTEAEINKILEDPSVSMRFPLSPENSARYNKVIDDTLALERAVPALQTRTAELENTIRSTQLGNPNLPNNDTIQKVTRDLSAAEIAALDFATLDIPERDILPDGDFAVRQLNTSAKALTDRLSTLGSLNIVTDIGGGLTKVTRIDTNAPANVAYDPARRVADVDLPTTFAPETEKALKSELVRAGALMDFGDNPQIAALPVATQLQLQSALRDYVAREKAGWDANSEAVKTLHNAGGEIATILLMETLETYGLENIPGLEASVGKSISAFTQGLAKIGDARNPEEGFKQFGAAFADAGKAFGQGMSDTFTGNSDASRRAEAEAAAKAAEERRLNLFRVAGDLMKLETDRVAAVAARDRNLEQTKQLRVAIAQYDETKKELVETQFAAEASRRDMLETTAQIRRDQVNETLTARANDAGKVRASEIAAAEAKAAELQAQSSAIAALKLVK